MPRKELYHNAVHNALVKDGWTIIADPFYLPFGNREVYVDFGADRVISAEKGIQKIAVEVKTFAGASEMYDLESAVGQYNVYRDLLSEFDPERIIYLAIPPKAYRGIFSELIGQFITERQKMRLLVYDEKQEVILKWIPPL